MAEFVFDYFWDSQRILATFAKIFLKSLFATRSNRYPGTIHVIQRALEHLSTSHTYKGRSRENFPVDRIFFNFHRGQIMNYLCQKCKKIGGHQLCFTDKACKACDFEKLAHVLPHVVQGFIVKNIEGESSEANDLSHTLKKWVCCVKIPKVTSVFTKLYSSRGI